MVAVMVFFPVMVNTIRGLTRSNRPRSSYALVRGQRAPDVRKLRIPNALPFFFTALGSRPR